MWWASVLNLRQLQARLAVRTVLGVMESPHLTADVITNNVNARRTLTDLRRRARIIMCVDQISDQLLPVDCGL